MMTSSNGSIFRVTGPLCGEFTGPGEFTAQRPVTRSFDVSFDLRLNKRLSKQPWGWWFETPAWSLWRHRNDIHGWHRLVTLLLYLNSIYAYADGARVLSIWTSSVTYLKDLWYLNDDYCKSRRWVLHISTMSVTYVSDCYISGRWVLCILMMSVTYLGNCFYIYIYIYISGWFRRHCEIFGVCFSLVLILTPTWRYEIEFNTANFLQNTPKRHPPIVRPCMACLCRRSSIFVTSCKTIATKLVMLLTATQASAEWQ